MRTLIVEDSALFREVFQEALHARFPAMEIVEATRSEEAFEKMRYWKPDLVFIDIHLQEENGLDIARRMKSEYPEATIIILTNYDFPEYREAAFRFKADHFIPKDSFMKMVNTLLPIANNH